MNWQGLANAEYTSIASEIEACVSAEHLFRLPKQTSAGTPKKDINDGNGKLHIEACTAVRKLARDVRQVKCSYILIRLTIFCFRKCACFIERCIFSSSLVARNGNIL